MNQHTLMHMLIRQGHVDSPEHARRREHLLWLKREAHEARKRRRRERARRRWNVLTTFHRTASVFSR